MMMGKKMAGAPERYTHIAYNAQHTHTHTDREREREGDQYASRPKERFSLCLHTVCI